MIERRRAPRRLEVGPHHAERPADEGADLGHAASTTPGARRCWPPPSTSPSCARPRRRCARARTRLQRLHGLRAAGRAPARRRRPLPDVQPADGGADRRAGRPRRSGKTPARDPPPDVVGNSDALPPQVVETGKLHVSEQHLTYHPDDSALDDGDPLPGPRRRRPGRGGRHLRGGHHRAQGGRGGAAGVRGAAERDQRRQPGADEHRRGSPTASSSSSTSPISGSSGWRTSTSTASTAPRSTRTRPSATGIYAELAAGREVTDHETDAAARRRNAGAGVGHLAADRLPGRAGHRDGMGRPHGAARRRRPRRPARARRCTRARS